MAYGEKCESGTVFDDFFRVRWKRKWYYSGPSDFPQEKVKFPKGCACSLASPIALSYTVSINQLILLSILLFIKAWKWEDEEKLLLLRKEGCKDLRADVVAWHCHQ